MAKSTSNERYPCLIKAKLVPACTRSPEQSARRDRSPWPPTPPHGQPASRRARTYATRQRPIHFIGLTPTAFCGKSLSAEACPAASTTHRCPCPCARLELKHPMHVGTPADCRWCFSFAHLEMCCLMRACDGPYVCLRTHGDSSRTHALSAARLS